MPMPSHPSNLAPLPIALPLLGAAFIAATRKWLSRAAVDTLGIVFALLTLGITTALLLHSSRSTEVYWFGNWYPRGSMALGITFVVDPTGAGLATLAALLTLLSLIFAWRLVDSGGNRFQPLMLLFLAAMCGCSRAARSSGLGSSAGYASDRGSRATSACFARSKADIPETTFSI